MSRYIKISNKALSGLKVESATNTHVKYPKSTAKDKKLRNLLVFGKVDRNFSNFIVDDTGKKYIDDVSELPKSTKRSLLKHFLTPTKKGNIHKTAYLVRDPKNLTGADKVKYEKLTGQNQSKKRKPGKKFKF